LVTCQPHERIDALSKTALVLCQRIQNLFHYVMALWDGRRYQKLSGVPDHIVQVSAEQCLPQTRMQSLYESGRALFPVSGEVGTVKRCKHSPVICLIADCVRLKYANSMTQTHFDRVCIADCDATWLRKFDGDLGYLGFQFASCIENPCSYDNKNKVRMFFLIYVVCLFLRSQNLRMLVYVAELDLRTTATVIYVCM
jgi:hypothetical protein